MTGTSITSSSYPGGFTILGGSRDVAALNAAPLELDGTYARAGGSADGIDSQCYSGTTTTLVGTQSAPGNGVFAVRGAPPVGSICDLRAVPSGTVPTSTALASYPPLRQAFDYAGATPGDRRERHHDAAAADPLRHRADGPGRPLRRGSGRAGHGGFQATRQPRSPRRRARLPA